MAIPPIPAPITIAVGLFIKSYSPMGECEGIEKLAGALAMLGSRHPVERSAEAQVLVSGELGVEVALVGNDPHQVPGPLDVGGVVTIEVAYAPLIGACKAREKVDGRGLACAVRTGEPEDLPGEDGEVHSFDRLNRAVSFPEILDLYRSCSSVVTMFTS